LKHYLDTSILAAYYAPEERTGRVEKFISQIGRSVISPLVEVELYCAIARKVRSNQLDHGSAVRILSMFQAHISDDRYVIVPIQAREYVQARDWIAQLASPLRVLDALHLAAASSHSLVLATSDRALAESARLFGVKSKLIE
jgi:predicted nucleic acid-binding protein